LLLLDARAGWLARELAALHLFELPGVVLVEAPARRVSATQMALRVELEDADLLHAAVGPHARDVDRVRAAGLALLQPGAGRPVVSRPGSAPS
jgi:hypothetical protein